MTIKCWKCNGFGKIVEEDISSEMGNPLICPVCKGTGQIKVETSKVIRKE